jgi:hypothetical protein
MSHRAIVKTVINDLDMLKKTIKDLGFSYYEGQELTGSYTSNWTAEQRKADIVMDMGGRKDIGFRKTTDGFYSLIGDFFGLAMSEKALSDKVAQRYSVNKIRKEISNSSSYGINSLSERTLANGEIVLEGEIDEQQILA